MDLPTDHSRLVHGTPRFAAQMLLLKPSGTSPTRTTLSMQGARDGDADKHAATSAAVALSGRRASCHCAVAHSHPAAAAAAADTTARTPGAATPGDGHACNAGARPAVDDVRHCSVHCPSCTMDVEALAAMPTGKRVTLRIVCLLQRVCEASHGSAEALAVCDSETVFRGQPSIPLDEFVQTSLDMLDYLRIERGVLLGIVVYVLRAVLRCGLVVSGRSVFRLFLASLLVSMKYGSDRTLHSRGFAQYVGMSPPDICTLERGLLRILEYRLFISEQDAQDALDELGLSLGDFVLGPA